MSDTEDDTIDLFQEPAEYYKPQPDATFASHTLLSGGQLTLRLVGHNPLWVSKKLGNYTSSPPPHHWWPELTVHRSYFVLLSGLVGLHFIELSGSTVLWGSC